MNMPRVCTEAERIELTLPDGRVIDYAIRPSARARSVRLRLSPREGMIVVAPVRMGRRRVISLVATKADWVGKQIDYFEAVRRSTPPEPSGPPASLSLRSVEAVWTVAYRAGRADAVSAREVSSRGLLVAGGIEDMDACEAALRRWLIRHARTVLSPWVARLAASAGLRYEDVTIRNQRSRWGSCSAKGRISLSCKLLFLPPDLVDYVIWHELSHLLELNHSDRFWAHLRGFVPDMDARRLRMRDAWVMVPPWV